MAKLSDWSQNNNKKLQNSLNKPVFHLCSRKNLNLNISFELALNDVSLVFRKTAEFLEVMVDADLSFRSQIRTVCNEVIQIYDMIRRVQLFSKFRASPHFLQYFNNIRLRSLIWGQ